jgi:hypothetical protein
MNTGWKTTEMQRHAGRLTMSVAKICDDWWSAWLFVSYGVHHAGHTIDPQEHEHERFTSSMDAIDAIERYAAQLGPVEPVMALITAFSRGETYQRRARREAA